MREPTIKTIAESDYNQGQDLESRFRFEFSPTLESKPTQLKLYWVGQIYDKNGTQFLSLGFATRNPRTKKERQIQIAVGFTVSEQNKTGKLLRAMKIDVDQCGYPNIFQELKKRVGQYFRAVFERDRVNPALFRIRVDSLRSCPTATTNDRSTVCRNYGSNTLTSDAMPGIQHELKF